MSYQATHRTFAYLFACASRHLEIARYTEAMGKKTTGVPPSIPKKKADPIEIGMWMLTGGDFYDTMSSLTFCALAVEAAVNHVGATLFDHWSIYEKKLSTREKIDLLSKLKKKDIDFGDNPFSYLARLQKFRNALAHGKTETVKASSGPKGAEPEWMSMCSIKEAERAVDATRQLIEFLFKKFLRQKNPLLHLSSGSGTGRFEH